MNKDTTLIKLIAFVCMILDHTGAILFPRIMWLRVVGRVAFPLFAWCVAVGAHHTKNIKTYALRLLGFCVVSQPFYMLALNHPWHEVNIFLTLFLGLCGIYGIQSKQFYVTIISVLITMLVSIDYGMRGVVLIILLYLVYDKPFMAAMFIPIFCVAWGSSIGFVSPISNTYISLGKASRNMFTLLSRSVKLQTLSIMALPVILFPRSKRTNLKALLKLPEKALYYVYPAHLLILFVIDKF